MKRVKNWQRYLAAFMAAMMMFSCLNVTAFAATGSESQDGTKWTVTTAELVAAANSEEMAAFIEAATAEAISKGVTYTVDMPADTLVNAEVQSIGTLADVTAKAKDGWTPVSVVVKTVGTDVQEWQKELPMTDADSDGVYTAEVSVPQNEPFVAEVTYKLSVAKDEVEDSRLVNLAKQLKDAQARIGEAVAANDDLQVVSDMLAIALDNLGEGSSFEENAMTVIDAVSDLDEALIGYGDSKVNFVARFPWVKGAAIKNAVEAAWTEVSKLADAWDDLIADFDEQVAQKVEQEIEQQIRAEYPYMSDDRVAEAVAEIAAEAVPAAIEEFHAILDPVGDEIDAIVNDGADGAAKGSLYVVNEEAWDDFLLEENTPAFTAAAKAVDYRNAEFDKMVAALTNVAAVSGNYNNIADKVVSYRHNVMTVNVTINGTIGDKRVGVGEAVGDDAVSALFALTGSVPAAETAPEEVVRAKVLEEAARRAKDWNKPLEQFTVAAAPVDGKLDNWTVTYTPKQYTVSFGGGEHTYPYGTEIVLTKLLGDPDSAYRYEVNEETKKQGTRVLVDQKLTISREVVNAEKVNTVLSILVNDPQYALNDPAKKTEKDILSSPALVSPSITYTKPAVVPTFEVREGKYVVTAPAVDGWAAYELEAVRASGEIETYTVSNMVASWDVIPATDEADPFTNANVKYRKSVVGSAEETLAYLNLPRTLKADVDKLRNTLDAVRDVYTENGATMASLEYGQLNAAKIFLDSDAAKAAMSVILNDGWDTVANTPKIYALMDEMAALKWSLGESLTGEESSYYALIKEQVKLFTDNMGVIVADSGFGPMLDAAGHGDKKADIEDICTDLDALLEKFADLPEGVYDETAGDFAALINRIDDVDAAVLPEYADGTGGICVYETVTTTAEGFKTQYVTVTVETASGDESETDSLIVAEDEDFGANEIAEMIAALEAKLYERGVLSEEILKYYDVATDAENCLKSYTMKYYTVRIVENGTQINSKEFRYVDQLLMPIPREGSNEDIYYRYYIGNTEIPTTTGNYAFAMDAFGNGDEIVITRKSINKAQEKYEQFVSGLNDAVADLNGMVTFVPVTENDVKSIVMQIAADQNVNMDALLESVSAAFMSLTYDYIGVDVGVSGRQSFSEDGELEPQAMVNMLLNSGLTNATLMSAVNKDGTINHVKLDDQNVGGKLAESKLYLGDNVNKYEKVNFYITLTGADAAKMAELRSTLEKADGFVEFGLFNGKFAMEATIPQSVFSVYLAMLVMVDRYDWDTIADLDLKAEVKNIVEILDGHELTAETVQALLADYVDLSDYTFLVDRVLSALQNANPESLPGTFTPDSWSATVEYDIREKMKDKLGDIEFENTVLSIPVSVTVTNYGDLAEVEALVVEIPELNTGDPVSMENAAELADTVKFVDDIAALLETAGTPVYVMLMQNYEGDLTVNRTAVLDLNGMTVTGNIAANSELTVVSRVLNAAEAGTVDGALSGKISLAAGTYTADVEQFVGNGYALVDGTVVNEYYQISEEGNATVVTLNLEALMAQLDQGNLQTLMLDILSDALLNIDAYAKVSVAGQTLYDINLDGVKLLKDAYGRDFEAVAQQLLDQVNVKAAEEAFKEIFNELADKAKIKAAIKEGGELASFSYSVANWAVVPSLGGAEGTSVTIKSGSVQDKVLVINTLPLNDAQKDTVSKLYSAITDLVDVNNRSFTLGKITYSDKNLSWSGSAKADVTIDLTQGEDASDYVTVLALILANNEQNAEKKAELIANILYYYNNEWSEGLEKALADMTVADLVNALDALHTGEEMTTDLKALIAQLMDGSNTKYLKQLVNETKIPESAKKALLEGQTKINFADLEKVAELEDIYDIVLAMGIKLAEGLNAVANADANVTPGERLDDEAAAAQAKMKTFLNQHLNKLSGDASESLSYGGAELKITLKLFADEYVSAVEVVVAAIKALPAELPENVTDLDAFYALVLEIAKIDALVEGMSEGAKAMISELAGADYAKLEAAREYVKNHGEELDDFIQGKIDEIGVLAISDDLIADHCDPAVYAEHKKAVEEIRAVYESIKEYAAENDLTIATTKLEDAEEYFAYWDGVLENVVNLINAIEEVDGDNEAILNAMYTAKAAYDVLGPNAKAYVDAVTQKALETALEQFDLNNMLWITEIAPQTYTGTAIKPVIAVYEGLNLLQEKVDYTISYKNNTKAFDADDFASYEPAYEKAKVACDAAKVDYDAANEKYTELNDAYEAAKNAYNADKKNAALKTAMSDAQKAMNAAKTEMNKAKTALTKAEKAVTTAQNNLAKKAPAVIVNFKKNYTGQAYRYFEINRVDLSTANTEGSNLTIGPISVAAGTKVSAIKPVVMLNGKKVATSEYNVYVSDIPSTGVQAMDKNDKLNVDGTYYVILAAKDINFSGSYIADINVGTLMSKVTIGKIAAQDYDDWAKWADAGIVPYDEDGNVQVMPDMVFDWAPEENVAAMHHGDEITVTYGTKKIMLFKDIHYTVSYQNNTGTGTATATITGTGRTITADEYKELSYIYMDIGPWESYKDISFVGTKSATFKINGMKLTTKMVNMVSNISMIYTGNPIELYGYGDLGEGVPGHYKLTDGDTVLKEGTDFTVTYQKNIDKGTATVTFTGIGNYTGTVKKTFKIVAADFNGPTTYTEFTYNVEDAVYNKSGAKAEVTVTRGEAVKLVEGKDYTLSYKNNKKVVSADAIKEANEEYIAAFLNYAEATTKYESGEITKTELNQFKSAESAAYKALQKIAPTVTITGKGNYAGKTTKSFAIAPADFREMVGVAKDVLYKDKAGNFKTTFTLTDADGKKLSTSDYDSKNVTYCVKGEEEYGFEATDKVTVAMTDKGYVDMVIHVAPKGDNYTGVAEIEYRLYTTDITKAKIDRNTKAVFVYDRTNQEFVGTVEGKGIVLTLNGKELTPDVDYKVSYAKNFLPGTATAEIVGMNEFGGSKKITFSIKKNSDAVSALDDRIHFFENNAAGQMLSVFGTDGADLMLYTATPIVLF